MKTRLIKILFIAAVALLLLKSGVSAAFYLWPQPEADNTGNAAAQELIRLTNAYRQGLGLNALAVNPRLTQAAVNKAKDLLSKQYFSHTSPEGKRFSNWVKEVNYSYFYVGENLAIDFAAPQEVFDAWLNSPKHKENIERKEFQEIGMADLKGRFDGRETSVVVQLFGSRVLGENELSTGGDFSSAAGNYFSSDIFSPTRLLELINRYLDYLLFAAIMLLILAIIFRRIRLKKTPQKEISSAEPAGRIKIGTVKKQAPPLISLYTKQPHGNINPQAPKRKATAAAKK